jgi:hypothetical protein
MTMGGQPIAVHTFQWIEEEQPMMGRDISQEDTIPLPRLTNAFHAYLLYHRLTWVQVARAAGVPGVTVWSIEHGFPVLPSLAFQVRLGLRKLTGVPYLGPIPTFGRVETASQSRGEARMDRCHTTNDGRG